jgi:hypothetical protein
MRGFLVYGGGMACQDVFCGVMYMYSNAACDVQQLLHCVMKSLALMLYFIC